MKHELLAPAGNIEAGYAALFYGADAVYLGLNKFSARAGAQNFTFEELDEFTAYAHSLKRKVFVAVNTILTEDEINELPETFAAIEKAKVDGLIIQDLGVYYLAKKLLPEIELHASTQMSIHNLEGAKFLYELGFNRVVLARELSLSEIKKIAEALPDLDLEVFVHGALCYSYSGQCLFSALEYGKSANRGRCVYPCRGEFLVDNCRKSHLFSMKDLALEEKVLQIPTLSLKIEGRKKSPLYVAAVTNYYRHLLDGKKKDLAEAEDIKQIFSRPWCKFHFAGNDKDIIDEKFVGHRGLLIGKVEKISKNILYFRTNHKISRYDGLQIDVTGDEKPFGFGIKNLFSNKKSVFEVKKGEIAEAELPAQRPMIEIGAPIYLASSSEVKGKYDYSAPKPKEFYNAYPIEVTVEIENGKIWAICDTTAEYTEGDFPPANDAQKTEAAVCQAFSKTGGTPFHVAKIEVKNPLQLFVPVSVLNELRRKLLSSLVIPQKTFELPKLKNSIVSPAKLQNISTFDIDLHTTANDFLSLADKENVWLVLPQICRNTQKLAEVIKNLYNAGARKFVAENYYAFELLKKYKDAEIIAGSFLYVMNQYAAEVLHKIGCKMATIALESPEENTEKLAQNQRLPLIQVTKANPPLFTSAVCVRNNDCKNCTGGLKTFSLKKDGQEYIAVSKDCQVQVFSKEKYEREPVAGISAIFSSEKKYL